MTLSTPFKQRKVSFLVTIYYNFAQFPKIGLQVLGGRGLTQNFYYFLFRGQPYYYILLKLWSKYNLKIWF